MEEPTRHTAAEDVTRLLEAIDVGDRRAADELLPLVYGELRKLAASRLARLAPGQTLQPTALVHEAYLELIGKKDPGWKSRGHFFGAAAHAMRDILVDAARRKSRLKHGGDQQRVELVDSIVPDPGLDIPADDLLAMDEALVRLGAEHPRKRQIVMLRYFAGLSNELLAEVLDVSTRTIEREWRFAKAWLHKELAGSANGDEEDNHHGPEDQ